MIINSNGKLTKREVTALEDSYLGFGLSNFLLINTDEILQTRGGGHGLIIYDRLYDDPHVQSVMNKLADAVISRDWVVAPASDKRIDKRAADIVRDQLTHLNTQDLFPTEENHTSVTGFDAVTRSMIISGRLNGYCCGEVMWRSDGALTVANEVRLRDSRLFGFKKGEYGYTLRFLSKSQVLEGVPVEPKKVVVFSYGALDGSPYGRALGRVLFWPVFFKKQVTRFDLKFLENFSSPKVVGKYPRGTQGAAVDTLMNAIDAIAQETGVAIPEGMLLEYLQASTSGTVDAYERSLKYWDEQISEAVLGETGTTNQSGSGGSRARDQVGNEVRLETSKAIADALSSTFNRLASWITAYNVPDAIPPTVYRDFGEAEDLEKRSTRDKTLFDMGYRLSGERVIDTYGEGYEEAMTPDKPALISTIGVAGVTALTAILAQAESGQLPRENAVAVLVSVFGIEQADAEKMVPAEKPPEKPQANPLDGLFGGQGQQGDQQQPGQQPPGQTQFAESTPDPADLITDKARPLVQSALAPWLQTVTDFVEQASSLEEIRDGLADLYPSLDPKDFAEAMGQAMLLSDLAGQSEVLSEADEVAFAEAIEAALNGTLDFAAKPAGSKPKCNPAKSHFCQKPGGKGSCVGLSKKCKFKPTGQTKQAADYVGAGIGGGDAAVIQKERGEAIKSLGDITQKIEKTHAELAAVQTEQKTPKYLADKKKTDKIKATYEQARIAKAQLQAQYKTDLGLAESEKEARAVMEKYRPLTVAASNKFKAASDKLLSHESLSTGLDYKVRELQTIALDLESKKSNIENLSSAKLTGSFDLSRQKTDPTIGAGEIAFRSTDKNDFKDAAKRGKRLSTGRESYEETFKGTDGKDIKVTYAVEIQRGLPHATEAVGVEARLFLEKNWNGTHANIAWDQEGSKENSPDSIKTIRTAQRVWQDQVIKKISAGTLLFNQPLGGPGGARDRLYQRQGFGKTNKSESQYAIMGKNGKIIPIQLEDLGS